MIPRFTEVINKEEIFEEIFDERRKLEEVDEATLADMWTYRTYRDGQSRFKWRRLIWDEVVRRYDDVVRAPIEIRLPYLEKIDGKTVDKRHD